MAESSIPVDLFNPGQVFACLGFLEAADVLCGDAEGGFDWSDEAEVRFCLRADGDENPFEAVLEFLAKTKLRCWGPVGYSEPPPKASKKGKGEERNELELHGTFPAHRTKATQMALPICLSGENRPAIELGHWADGSSRKAFKLYSGNRSAYQIADAMLRGDDKKTKGIAQLWGRKRNDLIKRPLDITTPMGGSFNFDPRGGWTAIDAGYSPNDQKHQVEASPVVEILSAWGLENARPDEFETRKVRYAAWGVAIPPMLARVALVGGVAVPMKRFRFDLDMSGKNKVVTFAEQEIIHD